MIGAAQTSDAAQPSFRTADGNEAENMTSRAAQAAEQAIDDIKARAAEYMEIGRGKAGEMTTAVEGQIRQRPVQALAIAAGIGFGLGFLWTRRS